MHTGILDIPVLYLCFALLSYFAFALAKFVHKRNGKFALNVNGQSGNNYVSQPRWGFYQSICPSRVGVC